MAVQFEQLDLNGYAKINDKKPSESTTYSSQKIEEILPEPGAVIDDSKASTTKTYSSTHIDKTYLKKDGNGSGVSVEYTASDKGNAPTSGSMLGNLTGWIVGKCNRIGVIANLVTTAKTNLVAAINEVKMEIGDLKQLDITEKTDLVTAINELNSKILEYKVSDESVLIDSNTRADLTVNFEKGYVSPPIVIATPYTSTGVGVEIAIQNITNDGFTVNMKNEGASAAYFKVCYVALNTTL